MWGVFIGIGLGAFQVWLLRKTAAWITSDKSKGTLMAVPVILLKLVIILGTLYALAYFFGLPTMVWAAGGLLVTMIALSIYLNRRQVKKQNEQEADR